MSYFEALVVVDWCLKQATVVVVDLSLIVDYRFYLTKFA
jgi:hypothetical protein